MKKLLFILTLFYFTSNLLYLFKPSLILFDNRHVQNKAAGKEVFIDRDFLFCNYAFAQESGTTLEPIIVEETPLKPPLDYPSAFSTVIDLEDFGGEYNTTSEILSFSPGVFVRDFGGFGQLQTLSIRGSSNDQAVVLLDGVRLNTALGGIDLSTIPLNYVEKFEIIKTAKVRRAKLYYLRDKTARETRKKTKLIQAKTLSKEIAPPTIEPDVTT